ncbi:uncharacterized protein [Nicotiana tomentosiformis]|uniref:uncharacterized protein n=1 Tax=Nicotiana tomentosiformis TaxID=4098 RepID=UPI00388CD774
MPKDEHRILEMFERLRPPSFSGTEGEDAQGYLERCRRILRTTGILEISGVSFTTFQFSRAAFSWGQFNHGRGRPFSHAQTTHPVYRGASSSHGAHTYQQGQSSFSILPAQSSSHAPSTHGSSVSGPSSSYFGARGSLQSPPPFAKRGCFKCGDLCHIKRHCPRLSGGSSQQRSQPSTSALVTSPPAQPDQGRAQSARGRPRGGGRSGGSQARLYALPARPDAIASDAVITCIVLVFHRDASVLFDSGPTYSCVLAFCSLSGYAP